MVTLIADLSTKGQLFAESRFEKRSWSLPIP